MGRALQEAGRVRAVTSPNPWVGCVIEPGDFRGATEAPGGRHAEIVALAAAGSFARGATAYVTLEPCCHFGRTPPCVDALVDAGIRRVVIGITDPDPLVTGRGLDALRSAGVQVELGVRSAEVSTQLAPYIKHRTTGRPWVILKLAATLDGATAAADGSSRWITGPQARADAHRMRAESDAVIVGANTIRMDDPDLDVRDSASPGRQPLRVVLGTAPADARAQPVREFIGDPGRLLDELAAEGLVQVMVEGGAAVAGAWHRADLVDRYVFYLAPALAGGESGRPMLAGAGPASIDELWRGRIVSVQALGDDIRVELAPLASGVADSCLPA